MSPERQRGKGSKHLLATWAVILEDPNAQDDGSLAHREIVNAIAIAFLMTLLLERPTVRTNRRRRDFGNERELQRLTRPVFGLVNHLEVFQRQDVTPPLQLLLLLFITAILGSPVKFHSNPHLLIPQPVAPTQQEWRRAEI